MLNVRGRGFQGFKKVIAEQALPPAAGESQAVVGSCGPANTCSANNVRTTTEFNQEFPLTDRVKRVVVERRLAPTGTEAPLTDTTYGWYACYRQAGGACTPGTPAAGSALPTWLVYPSITVEKRYEVGQALTPPLASAAPLATKTSIAEVDPASGEPATSCQIVQDAYATTLSEEVRTLFDDTTAWWLGRVEERLQLSDFTTAYAWSGSLPATCPRPSAPEKERRAKYTYVPSGSAYRKVQSEELLLRGANQAKADVPNVSERKTVYGYDPSAPGNLATEQVIARDVFDDARQPVTLTSSYTYTADQYFQATETNPARHRSTQAVDAATGQLTYRQAVQNGPATSMSYDALGRILSAQVTGEQVAFQRILPADGCPSGNDAVNPAVFKRQVIQAGAPTKTDCVDLLGRVVAVIVEGFDGAPVMTRVDYNERGTKIREYVPWNQAGTAPFYTEYSGMDALGRVERKTVLRSSGDLFAPGEGDPKLETMYSYLGFTTMVAAAKASAKGGGLFKGGAIVMSRTNDSRGKLVQTTQQVTDARKGTHNIVTNYKYDSAGDVTEIIDNADNHIVASYDDLSRKLNVADPDRGQWTYVWDGLGRLTDQTDARNAWTGYKYDAIGRPVLRGAQGAADTAKVVVASWVYDQNGQYGTLSKVTGDAVNADAYSESYQYDALLRPTKVAIHMPPVGNAAARDFAVGYGYDQNYGRVKARSYPSGQLVAFDYDDRGYALGEVGLLGDGSRGTLYRRVNAMSARGQVTDQTLGNDIVETAQFDASTGLPTWASSTRPPGTASTCKTASGTAQTPLMLVRQMRYQYDQFLNLASQQKTYYRRDAASGFPDCTSGGPVAVAATESYSYDDLQRLLGSARTWTDDASLQADSYAYDDLGNITQKSDFGSVYTYGMSPRGAELAGPHAVASIQKTDGTTATYTYDSNGNLVQGDGRTITFDRNDRPVRVAMGAVTTEFYYSPDGSRYAQHETGSADGARTVFYVDKDYELVAWDGGAIEERSYVGSSVVIYRRDSKPAEVRYRHGDRLNSLDAVTDDAGNEIATDLHGYDAFGKPRGYDWRPNQGAAFERLHASEVGVTTNDGFTTHEHLDEVYLIHMNGRVYDYRMGRFLSVDPIISSPANSQAINPYSYIGNNPLSGVDPTGYESVGTGCGAFSACEVQFVNASPATIALYAPANYSNGALGQSGSVAKAGSVDQQSPQQVAQQDAGQTAGVGVESERGSGRVLYAQVGPPIVDFEYVPWENRPGGEAEARREESGAPPERVDEIIAAGRVRAAMERIQKVGGSTAEIREPGPRTEKEAEFWERAAEQAEAAARRDWKGPTDYSEIRDPKNVGATIKPTARQVSEMKATNRAQNDGVLRSDQSGKTIVDSAKSAKGVTPPKHETQVDHVTPVNRGGTRAMKNLRLISREENRAKWDK